MFLITQSMLICHAYAIMYFDEIYLLPLLTPPHFVFRQSEKKTCIQRRNARNCRANKQLCEYARTLQTPVANSEFLHELVSTAGETDGLCQAHVESVRFKIRNVT
jgi:hypothetical protein